MDNLLGSQLEPVFKRLPDYQPAVLNFLQKNKELFDQKIKQLKDLDDPRIWIIGGESADGSKVYYFDYVVNNILPDIDEEKIEESIEKVFKSFFKKKSE